MCWSFSEMPEVLSARLLSVYPLTGDFLVKLQCELGFVLTATSSDDGMCVRGRSCGGAAASTLRKFPYSATLRCDLGTRSKSELLQYLVGKADALVKTVLRAAAMRRQQAALVGIGINATAVSKVTDPAATYDAPCVWVADESPTERDGPEDRASRAEVLDTSLTLGQVNADRTFRPADGLGVIQSATLSIPPGTKTTLQVSFRLPSHRYDAVEQKFETRPGAAAVDASLAGDHGRSTVRNEHARLSEDKGDDSYAACSGDGVEDCAFTDSDAQSFATAPSCSEADVFETGNGEPQELPLRANIEMRTIVAAFVAPVEGESDDEFVLVLRRPPDFAVHVPQEGKSDKVVPVVLPIAAAAAVGTNFFYRFQLRHGSSTQFHELLRNNLVLLCQAACPLWRWRSAKNMKDAAESESSAVVEEKTPCVEAEAQWLLRELETDYPWLPVAELCGRLLSTSKDAALTSTPFSWARYFEYREIVDRALSKILGGGSYGRCEYVFTAAASADGDAESDAQQEEEHEERLLHLQPSTTKTSSPSKVASPTSSALVSPAPAPTHTLDDPDCTYTLGVVVTPTRVLFFPPQPMLANRLLRGFGEAVSFLRVQFCTDNLDELNDAHVLCECIDRVFDLGIRVSDARLYKSLGWSNSQMRGKSLWLYHSETSSMISAETIRSWVGNLDKVYEKGGIPKYASRFALAFSSSRRTFAVDLSREVGSIPDVERNGYCFTDGSGQITCACAARVARSLKLLGPVDNESEKTEDFGFVPSAFQVRFGGAKGVLVQNPFLRDQNSVYLRPSQVKFECHHQYSELEVLSYSKAVDCHLNQQIVLLMLACGVPEEAFLELVEEALEDKARALLNPAASVAYLKRLGFLGVHINTASSSTSGSDSTSASLFDPLGEPFFSRLLQNHYRAEARKIRKRTAVRVEKGRTLLGVPDDHDVLAENEVFVQITERTSRTVLLPTTCTPTGSCKKKIVTGPVMVTKNPCLHPGDLRLPTAVDNEEVRRKLGHLTDVIVFSTRGDRDIPNMIAGSDLDGDMYHVNWDPRLRPTKIHDPMDYSEAEMKPDAVDGVDVVEDEDATNMDEKLKEYFKRACTNPGLGQIANAHKVFADMDGADCEQAVKLAKCHSDAVDFPKTGVPAEIPGDCRVEEWPEFMEKTHKPTVRRDTVLQKCADICPNCPENLEDAIGEADNLANAAADAAAGADEMTAEQDGEDVDFIREAGKTKTGEIKDGTGEDDGEAPATPPSSSKLFDVAMDDRNDSNSTTASAASLLGKARRLLAFPRRLLGKASTGEKITNASVSPTARSSPEFSPDLKLSPAGPLNSADPGGTKAPTSSKKHYYFSRRGIRVNPAFLYPSYQDEVPLARAHYERFCKEATPLLTVFGLRWEEELFDHARPRDGVSRRERHKMRELLAARVHELRTRYRKAFIDQEIENANVDSCSLILRKRAAAWYFVAYNPEHSRAHRRFLSFAWLCAGDFLMQNWESNSAARKALGVRRRTELHEGIKGNLLEIFLASDLVCGWAEVLQTLEGWGRPAAGGDQLEVLDLRGLDCLPFASYFDALWCQNDRAEGGRTAHPIRIQTGEESVDAIREKLLRQGLATAEQIHVQEFGSAVRVMLPCSQVSLSPLGAPGPKMTSSGSTSRVPDVSLTASTAATPSWSILLVPQRANECAAAAGASTFGSLVLAEILIAKSHVLPSLPILAHVVLKWADSHGFREWDQQLLLVYLLVVLNDMDASGAALRLPCSTTLAANSVVGQVQSLVAALNASPFICRRRQRDTSDEEVHQGTLPSTADTPCRSNGRAPDLSDHSTKISDDVSSDLPLAEQWLAFLEFVGRATKLSDPDARESAAGRVCEYVTSTQLHLQESAGGEMKNEQLHFANETLVHRAAVRARQQCLMDQTVLTDSWSAAQLSAGHAHKRFVFRRMRPEDYEFALEQMKKTVAAENNFHACSASSTSKSQASATRILHVGTTRQGTLVIESRGPQAVIAKLAALHRRLEEAASLPQAASKTGVMKAMQLRADDPFVRSADLYTDRQQLLDLVRGNRVVVVDSHTGSGKTTLVPLLLATEVLGRGSSESGSEELRRVLCTQVRRVATESAALRACQLAENAVLGKDIGYMIGGKTVANRSTKVVYAIDAIAMMTALQDVTALGFTHVVIDEVHTRTHYTDLLLAALKHFHLPRSPHLRVILMSASAESEKIAAYFRDENGGIFPKVYRCGGARRFEVREQYFDEIRYFREQNNFASLLGAFRQTVLRAVVPMYELAEYIYDLVHSELVAEWDQDAAVPALPTTLSRILVFLPGRREIDDAAYYMRQLPDTERVRFHVATLFGGVPVEQQQNTISELPADKVAIILATDVVETSVTIEHCDHVIDLCLHKRIRVVENRSQLTLERISRAEAKQRAGRTGRTKPGVVHRLIPRREFEALPQYPTPDILSMSVADVLLLLQDLLPSHVNPVQFLTDSKYLLDPIGRNLVEEGYQKLEEAGAFVLEDLLEEQEKPITMIGRRRSVSPLGRLMSELYLDVEFVQLVANGLRFGSVFDGVVLAAVLRHGSPFREDAFLPPRECLELVRVKRACAENASDILHRWGAWLAWRQQNIERWRRKQRCFSYGSPAETTSETLRWPSTTTTSEVLRTSAIAPAAQHLQQQQMPAPYSTDADLLDEMQWCSEHFIDVSKMREIEDTVSQIFDALQKLNFVTQSDVARVFGRVSVREAIQRRSTRGQRRAELLARALRFRVASKQKTILGAIPISSSTAANNVRELRRRAHSSTSTVHTRSSTQQVEDESETSRERILLWILASSFLPNLITTEGDFEGCEIAFELRKQGRGGRYHQQRDRGDHLLEKFFRHEVGLALEDRHTSHAGAAAPPPPGTLRFKTPEGAHEARQLHAANLFVRAERPDVKVVQKHRCYGSVEVLLAHDTACELSGRRVLVPAAMLPVAGNKVLARELSSLPGDMRAPLIRAMHPGYNSAEDGGGKPLRLRGVVEPEPLEDGDEQQSMDTRTMPTDLYYQGGGYRAELQQLSATIRGSPENDTGMRRAAVLQLWKICEKRSQDTTAQQKKGTGMQQRKAASFSEVVSVPAGRKGRVIGKGGTKLRSIEESSGAKVRMPPKGDPSEEVVVTGTETQVAQAVALIRSLI